MRKGTRYTPALGQGIEDGEGIITSAQTDNTPVVCVTAWASAPSDTLTGSYEHTDYANTCYRHITHTRTYAGLSLAV